MAQATCGIPRTRRWPGNYCQVQRRSMPGFSHDNDRQYHLYISRSFNFDNQKGGFDYSFAPWRRELLDYPVV
jgi:hypothetical protein